VKRPFKFNNRRHYYLTDGQLNGPLHQIQVIEKTFKRKLSPEEVAFIHKEWNEQAGIFSKTDPNLHTPEQQREIYSRNRRLKKSILHLTLKNQVDPSADEMGEDGQLSEQGLACVIKLPVRNGEQVGEPTNPPDKNPGEGFSDLIDALRWKIGQIIASLSPRKQTELIECVKCVKEGFITKAEVSDPDYLAELVKPDPKFEAKTKAFIRSIQADASRRKAG
jgi:hypothetical protein